MEVDNFFKNIVTSTGEGRASSTGMIQLMMKIKNKNDESTLDYEMTAQAFTFLLAGFNTVSTVMCFAAHEVAN